MLAVALWLVGRIVAFGIFAGPASAQKSAHYTSVPGFSPGYSGSPLDADHQKRKIAPVVDVARDVWGTA